MTRVNCVPVKELCNSHLLAEYREMLRFRHAKVDKKDILPETYRMGKGHVKFFYNKGKYLFYRHLQLCEELENRGIAHNLFLDLSDWEDWQMNDWEPTEEDMKINRDRIRERIDGMISRGIIVKYQ